MKRLLLLCCLGVLIANPMVMPITQLDILAVCAGALSSGRIDNKESLYKGVGYHHYTCCYCDDLATTNITVLWHHIISHANDNNISIMFICPYVQCSSNAFALLQDVENHVKKDHYDQKYPY